MPSARIIPILHVKGPNLVKGIHLEGLRVLGNPRTFADRYYREGADEIIYLDTVASLYGRNNLSEIVEQTTQSTFIPMAVGGGVRSVQDARHLMLCGAEKVCVNTAAVKHPTLITEIAETFGSQAMVLDVEARRKTGGWEALTDNGREETGRDAVQWIHEAVGLGAGEILVTSVDREGTGEGPDLDLIRALSGIRVPLVVNGGIGKKEHVLDAFQAGADAVGVASMFHYDRLKFDESDRCSAEGNVDFLRGKRGDVAFEKAEHCSIVDLKRYLSGKGVKCRMKW